ncbi:hypothetical protein F4678DRAFT_420419 [Xylaria arbuscula]|nr:hypothetical protein F4678DRAFT_420419 [Xylaria arbuscula]
MGRLGLRLGYRRIIILFVLSATLLIGLGWHQYRLQDKALLPLRILRMRSVLAGAWFTSCLDATLAVTEYCISIYFQGGKGHSNTIRYPYTPFTCWNHCR